MTATSVLELSFIRTQQGQYRRTSCVVLPGMRAVVVLSAFIVMVMIDGLIENCYCT